MGGGGGNLASLNANPSNLDSSPTTQNSNLAKLDSKNLATSFTFHIIHNGIKEKTHEKLRILESDLNKTFPCQIVLHETNKDAFSNLTPWGERANHITYFRLLIPEIVDSDPRLKNLSKCLYLDTDILVTDDIRAMFNLDLADKYCAMVKNVISVNKEWVAKLKLGDEFCHEYCNAGVVMMNLDLFKTLDMSKIFTFQHGGAPDQDFLNFMAYKKKLLLDLSYNICWLDEQFLIEDARKSGICPFDEKTRKSAYANPKIIHFVVYKPWHRYMLHPYSYHNGKFIRNPFEPLWREAAKKTPFAGEIFRFYYAQAARFILSFFIKAKIENLIGYKISIRNKTITKIAKNGGGGANR